MQKIGRWCEILFSHTPDNVTFSLVFTNILSIHVGEHPGFIYVAIEIRGTKPFPKNLSSNSFLRGVGAYTAERK